jgi:hypothetical protein
MPAKSDTRAVGSSGKKGGNAKWAVMGGLFFAVVVAVQTGWAGFGWAQLKSAVFPGDVGLLAYIPEDAAGVLLVDPHQIEPKALGSESGAVRQWLTRTRDDMKKATGVDLLFDVDKLAAAPSVVVVRGRFDKDALEKRLGEMSYKPAEHKGQKYLVRECDDALCIVSGSLLIYGDGSSITAALDAKDSGRSLEKKEGVVDRLKAVGFNHPVLGTMLLGEARPSVRDILTGSAGPRAVTVGLTTASGLDIDAAIESQSSGSAEELRKLLDEKRGQADALRAVLGGAAADVLVDAAKKAELKTDGSQVIGHVHLNPEQLDTLTKAAGNAAPFGALYKDLRLFQLLVPGL